MKKRPLHQIAILSVLALSLYWDHVDCENKHIVPPEIQAKSQSSQVEPKLTNEKIKSASNKKRPKSIELATDASLSATSRDSNSSRTSNGLERELGSGANSSSVSSKSQTISSRDLVRSSKPANLINSHGRGPLNSYRRAIQHESHHSYHELAGRGPYHNEDPTFLHPHSIHPTPGPSISSDDDFAGIEATESPIRLRTGPSSISELSRPPNASNQRTPLADQYASFKDSEYSDQPSRLYAQAKYANQEHDMTDDPRGATYGRGRLYGSEMGTQHSPSVEPPSNYSPEERSIVINPSESRSPHNIRVIFNNNPQFIIGQDAASANSRKENSNSRDRSKSRGHDTSYNPDEYNQDESRIEETKVSSVRTLAPEVKTPCDKDREEKLGPNLEQIDLSQEPVPQTRAPVVDIQQPQISVQKSEKVLPRRVVDPAPQTIAQPQQVQVNEPALEQVRQVKTPLDEQVITPFDQIVKSGIRPPLRMVISMRNKNGDILKVPINLQGSPAKQSFQQTSIQAPIQQHQQQEQSPSIDLSPQMQIHFEPPLMEKVVPDQPIIPPQQLLVSKQVDENTPIGGDVFDPSIIKPFTKTSAKARKDSPMSKLIDQLKAIAVADQDDRDQIPMQKQEKSIIPVATPPPPTPPVIPQVKTSMLVPQQQIGSLDIIPPTKTEPQIPITQVPTKQVVGTQPLSPSTKEQQSLAPQQLQEPRDQIKEPIQEPEITKSDVKQKKSCHDDEQRQHQMDATKDGQPNNLLDSHPISINTDNNGIVQMMIPTLTPLHNKTFASMFVQFQKALTEQMQAHQQSANDGKMHEQQNIQVQQQQKQFIRPDQQQQQQQFIQPNQQQQQQFIQPNQQQQQQFIQPNQQQQQQFIQPDQQRHEFQEQTRQQQQQDEHEDLMVAMMAANMRDSGLLNGDRRMTMTVIKPPKGTSVQDAILTHAKNASDSTRAVAILQSIQNKSKLPAEEIVGIRTQFQSSPKITDHIDQARDHPIAQPVDISLRTGGNPLMGQSNLPSLTSNNPTDPDGFSSEIRLTHLHLPQYSDNHVSRMKRSTDQHSASDHLIIDQQLEPADKLSIDQRAASQDDYAGNFLSRRPSGQEADKNSTMTEISLIGQRKKPTKSVQHRGQTSQSKSHLANKKLHQNDLIDAAASQQDEVAEGDESDEDSEAVDSNADSNADESIDSPSSSDLMDNESNGMNDDADESTGFGDSDDEPYNQGASSERDYNSPTSFEIPQIDLNPETLKQKGCKTVLREVQEIPLNGLGVVQADGQPGSGYGSQVRRRLKRNSGNQNSINSRKVTSIVMTKECHFPNEQGNGEPELNEKKVREQSQNLNHGVHQFKRNHLSPGSYIGSNPQATMSRLGPQQSMPSIAVNSAYVPSVSDYAHQANQYATYRRIDPKLAADFYDIQPKPQALHMLTSAQTPRVNYLTPIGALPSTNKTNSSGIGLIRDIVQPMSGRVSQPQLSPIKRRSVLPTIRPVVGPSTELPSRNNEKGVVQPKDIYVSADSRRDEVIARKLYKPPSAEDPYHTLSYSSQIGMDPDMDQDDDDSSIMGIDDRQDSAPSSKDRHEKQPRNRNQGPRSLVTEPEMHETLSDVERQALMDSNNEDTDPVNVNRGVSIHTDGNEDTIREDVASRVNEDKSTNDSGVEDSDESDADLTDESNPRVAKLDRSVNKTDKPTVDILNRKDKFIMDRNNTPLRDKTLSPSVVRMNKEHITQRDHHGAHRGSWEPHRFGESFKFEHSAGRPETGEVSAQLKTLQPGRHVSTSERREGDVTSIDPHIGLTMPTSKTSEKKFFSNNMKSSGRPALDNPSSLTTILRRRDSDDDADDNDDDDENGSHPAPVGVATGNISSRPRLMVDDPDSDPDYNPKESRIPTLIKPKKVQKSFAYVHRNLPHGSSGNPDDFMISYGKGNLQAEHEDYDSDREHPDRQHRPVIRQRMDDD